ncbi:MAG: alpha/beta fold hydrolase [Actinomycetota bacterium]|nr:alpha/beta fold hydrolase [Actinomycetota bacterium]
MFYDQLGCGNSTLAGDPEPWSVDLFLRELTAVRRELGLHRVHLLGHSWGGLLAMEHALGGADGLASLVLVGAVVSGPMVFECRRRFYEKLPPDAREAITSTRPRERSITRSTRRRWTSSTGVTPAGSNRGPAG